jgi:dTDP-4-dehydrorhamnose reductase
VARCDRHLIFRTSWVFAARGNNFARTMLRLASERDQLQVVADQIGAPTGAELLADVTAHAIRSVQQRPDLAGLYHLVPGGETSWHGYARHVIEYARQAGQSDPRRSARPSKPCRAAPTRCPPHARTTPVSIRASCRPPLT